MGTIPTACLVGVSHHFLVGKLRVCPLHRAYHGGAGLCGDDPIPKLVRVDWTAVSNFGVACVGFSKGDIVIAMKLASFLRE